MPRLPPRACRRGCRNLEPCPIHPRVVRRLASTRAYGPEWVRFRKVRLAEEPFCPGYGKWRGRCGRPTEQVDHKKTIRDGGARLTRENTQPYCGRCHRSKTATEDGAFGNVRRKPA